MSAAATSPQIYAGLAGTVAIVTGAAGTGIGASVADVLAGSGTRVVVCDLDQARVDEKVQALQASGAEATGVAVDVSDPSAAGRLVDAAVERFGGIDIVVNSAAMVMPTPLEDVDLEAWRKVYTVNVDGPLAIALAALPHLRKSSRASIVNIGALGGVYGRPNSGAYGSSKAALINLSYQMAMEWGPDGIRVNVVNPGTIDTPLTRLTLPPETARARARSIPLQRLGVPLDLANMVAFLASSDAAYITAQSINVDGGLGQTVMNAPMGT